MATGQTDLGTSTTFTADMEQLYLRQMQRPCCIDCSCHRYANSNQVSAAKDNCRLLRHTAVQSRRGPCAVALPGEWLGITNCLDIDQPDPSVRR